MAYRVLLSDLTDDQVDKLKLSLIFIPDNGFKYSNPYSSNKPQAIKFFRTVDNKYLDIPYLFASGFFNIIPNINNYFLEISINFTGKLWPEQIQPHQQCLDYLNTRGTCILGLPPSSGKTIYGCKLITDLKLLTVIMIPLSVLDEQWKNTIADFSDGVPWIVGEKAQPANCNIIICLYTRVNLIPEAIRNQVGFMIIDEAHLFCTQELGCSLLYFHPKYILAETATLLKDNGLHTMTYAICGKHGIFREHDTPFNVVKVLTGITPVREYTKYKKKQTVKYAKLVESTLLNDKRDLIILSLVKSNLHRKILILTGLKAHAAKLLQLLTAHGIDCDTYYGNQKSYRDGTVLIGTPHKIGTGFDQKSFCKNPDIVPFDLMILGFDIQQYAKLTQNCGRIFRSKTPVIFHLVDNDPIYNRHWNKCQKWYTLHMGIISEYNASNITTSRLNVIKSDSSTTSTSSNTSASSAQRWLQNRLTDSASNHEICRKLEAANII